MDSLILMSNSNETINPNMVINNNKGEGINLQSIDKDQKYRFLSKHCMKLVAKPRIELGFSASETLVLTIVRQGYDVKIINYNK